MYAIHWKILILRHPASQLLLLPPCLLTAFALHAAWLCHLTSLHLPVFVSGCSSSLHRCLDYHTPQCTGRNRLLHQIEFGFIIADRRDQQEFTYLLMRVPAIRTHAQYGGRRLLGNLRNQKNKTVWHMHAQMYTYISVWILGETCMRFEVEVYKCILSQRPSWNWWERFSLPRRLNIGFSRKSIKGLVIKVNKYSLLSELFSRLAVSNHHCGSFIIYSIVLTHTSTACNALYETDKRCTHRKMPIMQTALLN